eukprot:CAMPEP_0116134148 /NCGR_PEP_ID=MMETSP0329-20121206/10492_1 /TAXON_ID=697910 /ORGANISM="Pseudo-nitzschia arenysensis, Strain B593" /LENGTH=427 /DNA_ID=CAMNT_0003628841 /DNA_START=399 /DNA_END=1682 /DNA_ORIENTATION=-
MPSSSNNNRRHRLRNYTSVASQDADEEGDDNFHDEPITSDDNRGSKNDQADGEEEDEEEEEDLPMSLVILDSAQKRFPIPCDKSWTIGKFKKESSKIHKVAPAQQRLIFRGKMLTKDDQTLEENRLDTNDLIVHLFPKPRVVVTAPKKSSNEETENINRNPDDDGDSGIVDEDHGAHVPSIVIDQEEQDRRGQILVLGSVEIAESQNNVKMLSLLLVMICAMRLLALFSIAMGAVDEPAYSGDSVHNHTGDLAHNNIYDSDFNDDNVVPTQYEVRAWLTQDYFDLLVSGLGFYVGTLGMKATQENTSKLATMYAIGTIVAGIGWNLWNVYEYYKFYVEQMERQTHDDDAPDYNNGGTDEQPLTRDDFVTVAFFTIAMPLFVWFMCCVRAFEFRRLIQEAEEEAAERIRNEYTETANGDEEEGNHEIV